MYLNSFHIKNYRALRKAQLTFDNTIAIYGENGCGKSSIIEALHTILDPEKAIDEISFENHHFHRDFETQEVNQKITFSLRFKEQSIGEWSKLPNYNLQFVLDEQKHQLRYLDLVVESVYSKRNLSASNWKLVNPKTKQESTDQELIEWIRMINPLIRLSAGMLTGHGLDKLGEIHFNTNDNSFPKELQNHIKDVLENANAVFSNHTLNYYQDVATGYKAALQINEYLQGLSSFKGISLPSLPDSNIIQDKNNSEKKDSTSEQLGVLFLISALIQAIGNTEIENVDPVWLIEDPEAHLHKTTLATVSRLIKGIGGQKVMTTNSGALLSSVPLLDIRRLVRNRGVVYEYFVKKDTLTDDDIRRINYHLREHRSSVFFSKVWLMVEGETEFWILPRLAKILGVEFDLEAISCVEYAQSGLKALLKVANQMHIQWVLLADGDKAGKFYSSRAAAYLHGEKYRNHIAVFPAYDIEHYLWKNGFADVYINNAGIKDKNNAPAAVVIKSAIKKSSKPAMALNIAQAAEEKGYESIPKVIVDLISKCVKLARQ